MKLRAYNKFYLYRLKAKVYKSFQIELAYVCELIKINRNIINELLTNIINF